MSYYKPINSDPKTIRQIYDVQNPYFIDIYQREYMWTVDPIIELLTDIERGYRSKKPYFINTYLVSNITHQKKKS